MTPPVTPRRRGPIIGIRMGSRLRGNDESG
jgi:hypothetical protein